MASNKFLLYLNFCGTKVFLNKHYAKPLIARHRKVLNDSGCSEQHDACLHLLNKIKSIILWYLTFIFISGNRCDDTE